MKTSYIRKVLLANISLLIQLYCILESGDMVGYMNEGEASISQPLFISIFQYLNKFRQAQFKKIEL